MVEAGAGVGAGCDTGAALAAAEFSTPVAVASLPPVATGALAEPDASLAVEGEGDGAEPEADAGAVAGAVLVVVAGPGWAAPLREGAAVPAPTDGPLPLAFIAALAGWPPAATGWGASGR